MSTEKEILISNMGKRMDWENKPFQGLLLSKKVYNTKEILFSML